MFTIKTLNAISPVGLAKLNNKQFDVAVDTDAPDGILVRSADMHDAPLPDSLLAIARAAVAEDDDGILERGAVDAVNLLGREFAAAGLHVLGIHLLEVGQHPHALVRRRRERDARCGEQ